MSEHKQLAPFAGTKEQEEQLLQVIQNHKGQHGALMPILQEAQGIYGYLPLEVQTIISNETGISLERIYGVVTFYSQFSLVPKGEFTVSVCLGTACYVKGAGDLFNELKVKLGVGDGETSEDGKWTLEGCRCIGACGLAPVLTVNGDVHGRLGMDDLDKVIAQYA